jgi:hypothetical protein
VEDRIVPCAALNTAEQEIAQLQSDKVTLRQRVKGARDIVVKAKRALESTQALLEMTNERLVQAGLETVTAKVAPTTNGAAADGGSADTSTPLSDTDAVNVTQEEDPSSEEDHTLEVAI